MQVNGKNLAVGRLMVRGKDAEKRLKYLHVGPKGTTVFTPVTIARVSLPKGLSTLRSEIIPQEKYDAIARPSLGSDAIVDLPEGEPAVTGPHFLIPQEAKTFPEPSETTSTFTCNAEHLKQLLTIACEVSNDGDKTVRLRICQELGQMRIDAYRQPGDQEFIGVIKEMEYEGDYIPGDMPTGTPKVEKKPQQGGLSLRTVTGRRFRGDGE